MKHYRNLDNLSVEASWATVGSFDGIHLGHQELIREMVGAAHGAGYPAAVITFFPHPAVVLRRLKRAYYLTTPEERARLIGELGVDIVVTLDFTQNFSYLSPFEFMKMLSSHLGVKSLWVGYNFALGKDRQGDVPALEEIGKELGYSLKVLQPVIYEGEAISSSLIRKTLGEGDVGLASQYLGRWYSIECENVARIKRQNSDVYPGLENIEVSPWEDQLLPMNGCYACWINRDGSRLPAVIQISTPQAPTEAPTELRLRVWMHSLTQFSAGEKLTIRFADRLSPQLKVGEINEILLAMRNDS